MAIWLFGGGKPSFGRLVEWDVSAVTTAIMKEIEVPTMVRDVLQKRMNSQTDF